MAEFMVVLRGGHSIRKSVRKLTPSDASGLLDKYTKWVEDLRSKNRYLGGSPLKEGSKVLTPHKDLLMIRECPYPKYNEALIGYFLIEAPNLNEAIDIARGCPALTNGDSVEVLELDN